MKPDPENAAGRRLLLIGLAVVLPLVWLCYYAAYRRAEPSLEQLIFENTFDRSAAELVVVQVERKKHPRPGRIVLAAPDQFSSRKKVPKGSWLDS